MLLQHLPTNPTGNVQGQQMRIWTLKSVFKGWKVKKILKLDGRDQLKVSVLKLVRCLQVKNIKFVKM